MMKFLLIAAITLSFIGQASAEQAFHKVNRAGKSDKRVSPPTVKLTSAHAKQKLHNFKSIK